LCKGVCDEMLNFFYFWILHKTLKQLTDTWPRGNIRKDFWIERSSLHVMGNIKIEKNVIQIIMSLMMKTAKLWFFSIQNIFSTISAIRDQT
jgi:hypothetical protein